MALSPMKWQRCSTFTPGQAVSTMNAVICRFSFPLTVLDGVRAITTISSALVPLVHHSFSPFRIHAFPSSLGVAIVSIAAGSDPTPGSVSERGDGALGEARQVPLLLLRGAEHLERLRHTERLVRREERGDRAVDRGHQGDGTHVGELRQAEPAVFSGNLDSECAQLAQALNHRLGDFAFTVDAVRIDVLPQEQIEDEARRGPFLLARGFGDVAGLVARDLALRGRDGSGHGYLLL